MLRDEAKRKLAEEIEGKDHLIPFEEYLTEICTSDEIAKKILAEDKSLEGCFKRMAEIARGRKTGNFAYIPPEEGFRIIREYFEIDGDTTAEEETSNVVDIMDLL